MGDRLRRWWRQATEVEASASGLTDVRVRREGDQVFLDFSNAEGHSATMDMPVRTAISVADAVYAVTGGNRRA